MNRRKNTAVWTTLVTLGVLFFSATACHKNNNSSSQPTLYDSLGGTTKVNDPGNPGTMVEKGYLGIRTVVDSAIFIIAGDTAINGFFKVLIGEVTSGNTSGYQRLSVNLSNFVAVATGAKDYTYTGLSMTNAHNPATNTRMNGKADSHDFDVFVTDVAASATKNGVPSNLIASLGKLLYSVESQVVQK
ncbi:MAG TPA: group 1 truncated hemoglobin [Puia sp.]|jgi:hypothetical protein